MTKIVMIPFFAMMLALATANPIPQQILEDAQQPVSIHELVNQHHELVQSHVQNLLNLGTPAIQNAAGTSTGTTIITTDGGTMTQTLTVTNYPATQIDGAKPAEVQTTIGLPVNQGTGTGTGTGVASVTSTGSSSGSPSSPSSSPLPIGGDAQLQVKPSLEQQQILTTDGTNAGSAINVNTGSSSAISVASTAQQVDSSAKPLGSPVAVTQGTGTGAGSVTTTAAVVGGLSAPKPTPQTEDAQVVLKPISPPIQQQTTSSSTASVAGTALTGNAASVPALPVASPTSQIGGVILSGPILTNQGSGTGAGSVTATAAVVGDLSGLNPTPQIEDAQIAVKPLSPPIQQQVGSDGTGSAAGIATNTGSPVIAATIPTSQIQGDILSGPTLTSQGSGTGAGSITSTAVVTGDVSAPNPTPQIEDAQVAIKPVDSPTHEQVLVTDVAGEGIVSVNKVDASSPIPISSPTPQIESSKPVLPSIIQSTGTGAGSVTATASVAGDLSAPSLTPQIEDAQASPPLKEQGSGTGAGVVTVNAGADSQSVIDAVPQIDIKPANSNSGLSTVPVQISGTSFPQQGSDIIQSSISPSTSTGAGAVNVNDGALSVSAAGASSAAGSSSSKGSSAANAADNAQTGQVTGVVASYGGASKGK